MHMQFNIFSSPTPNPLRCPLEQAPAPLLLCPGAETPFITREAIAVTSFPRGDV
ncbi:hypothetical protein [Nostoc sp.]|uniref:hypothetical protein n=1 Tax=Nostoc sp. TaxID=1180 RepID=UPI002FF95B2F